MIEEKLEVVLPAYLFGIQPELQPIPCDCLDSGYLDSRYALWYNPECLCEASESCLCCPGVLHASVVMLLDHQVNVHPDGEPAHCLFDTLCGWVPNINLFWQLCQKAFLWAPQRENRAGSIFAVLNFGPCVFAHMMLFAAHLSSIVMT